jgi:hypothetical protein
MRATSKARLLILVAFELRIGRQDSWIVFWNIKNNAPAQAAVHRRRDRQSPHTQARRDQQPTQARRLTEAAFVDVEPAAFLIRKEGLDVRTFLYNCTALGAYQLLARIFRTAVNRYTRMYLLYIYTQRIEQIIAINHY